MREQLRTWETDFGNTYTKRNHVDWVTRVLGFARILEGLEINSLLEVGCNRGHNLVAISKVLEKCKTIGVEPNAFAAMIARTANLNVVKGNAYSLPFQNNQFDTVMTVAVLSHIDKSDLGDALDEIYRVSKQYILFAEYYAPFEFEAPYTGNGFWARNYLDIYTTRFPSLKEVSKGSLGHKDGFDKLSYWVLKKGER